MKVLSDGTILLGGQAGSQGAFLAELDVNGAPVSGFGGGGIATQDLGIDATPSGSIEDIQLLADGRFVAAGFGRVGNGYANELVVARFKADGELDPTFASGGIFRSDPTPGDDKAEALAVQPDGRIVVAGLRGGGVVGSGDTLLLRLTPNGQLDPSFGAGGETIASASPAADLANGLALQPDGRPVIAGYADVAGPHQLLVGRFTADGQPVEPIKAKARRCAGRKATLTGTRKADRIKGTKRADVIVALGGNDKIDAGGGNDLVCAGAGKDRVGGGKGRDRILGGAGRDRIRGGPGPDLCDGGSGKDVAGASCERLKRTP